jgi:hypothetical protein
MAWRNPFQAYRLSTERNRHVLVEDAVGEGRRNTLANDRFECALIEMIARFSRSGTLLA